MFRSFASNREIIRSLSTSDRDTIRSFSTSDRIHPLVQHLGQGHHLLAQYVGQGIHLFRQHVAGRLVAGLRRRKSTPHLIAKLHDLHLEGAHAIG